MGEYKKLRKQIKAEVNVIDAHLDKIANELLKEYPNRRDIVKWEKDVAGHQRILSKLTARLPGRRRQ